MKTIHKASWYWFQGKGWMVNAKCSGLYTHILRAVIGIFQQALSSHRRVFVFRFDIRPKIESETNAFASSIATKLRLASRLRYPKSSFSYCWVRESHALKVEHYHFVVFMDGRHIRHPHTLQIDLRNICAEQGGSHHWAGYHLLDKTKNEYDQSVQLASHHLSYLAKVRSKGDRPPRTRGFSTSRMDWGAGE